MVFEPVFLFHEREEDDVSDGRVISHDHNHSVDAESESTGGGHAVFEGFDEVVVHGVGVFASCAKLLCLFF